MLAFIIALALAAPAESRAAELAWCRAFNAGYESRGKSAVNPYKSDNERDGWENARSYRGWSSLDWTKLLPTKTGE